MNLPPLTPTDGRERPVRIDRRRRKVTTPGLAEVLDLIGHWYPSDQEVRIAVAHLLRRRLDILKPTNRSDPALYRKPEPSEEPLEEGKA